MQPLSLPFHLHPSTAVLIHLGFKEAGSPFLTFPVAVSL